MACNPYPYRLNFTKLFIEKTPVREHGDVEPNQSLGFCNPKDALDWVRDMNTFERASRNGYLVKDHSIVETTVQ